MVRLSLAAWAPVFDSLRDAMDRAVFETFFPDWRECQAKAVEAACADGAMKAWVADENGQAVAFVVVKAHSQQMGEIHMLAVDPTRQRRGTGKTLTDFALDWLTGQGVEIAMVETGGDPGHGPARGTYEKCGFRLLPVARYFKKLEKAGDQ